MKVTIVAGVYGDYDRFIPDWLKSVRAAKGVAEIVIAADRKLPVTGAKTRLVVVSKCDWVNRAAFYYDAAIRAAKTDWVWPLGVDDFLRPDALDGLSDVDADVVQIGFLRSDGYEYCPPKLTARQILDSPSNELVAFSPFRRAAYEKCGGYPDIGFEDWGLWRRLAHSGARFEATGRVHVDYTLHDGSLSQQLLSDPRHIAEALAV